MVFVQAVTAEANPDTPDRHRREGAVPAALRGSRVRAPRLLDLVDEPPWVMLVTECVPGANPALPWRAADLQALSRCLDELTERGTPSPAGGPPTVAEQFAADFTGWRRLAARADPGPWPGALPTNVKRLAEIEREWPAAAAGDSLVYADVRADNLLVGE